MDDIERLISRQAEADDAATREPGTDDPASPVIVGKTVAVGTYPTAASKFFWVTPQDVTGAETEGGAGTLTAPGGGNFLALCLGPNVPTAGSTVVCTWASYRFVFAY